jgi:hypothetical protein
MFALYVCAEDARDMRIGILRGGLSGNHCCGVLGLLFCLKKVTLAASMVIFCCAMFLESDGSKYTRPWRV